ncbi:fungal-specific transcription factor domain-containing protein [Talaromyces proteolyticus]|uniref:Fungal-specific transcription factor domain-containing protein n=1 Tax=Talaromyces proteolyticus TaxID=1131652 RepID=A0AAD4KUA3_9EURO|nr:fungal-specific transcription factor domain-containing protein [Talaromyces proteolyticus]KAH8698544.1 fungal-specific transcription factor domain-containing protein [Talaromyces proteolyticus]
MPGILPMKVIKVGNSTQSRIAQACDRCRSKKIRCDGIRPCCSQCSSVGFECKTSDKLSRRAFPRGYTESLEERVRSLESEVRELKDLLDEKDEKIELLSRIHSFASPSQKPRSPGHPAGAAASAERKKSEVSDNKGVIHVQLSSSLSTKSSSAATPFSGPSSVRAFSNSFKAKLSENGSSVSTKALTAFPAKIYHSPNQTSGLPPRLESDQLIGIYFQEWAPLYPVVHRPAILKAYDIYVTKPKSLQSQPHVVTQLNLIFAIAAVSSKSRPTQNPVLFERNWYPALESLASDVSISTMQCLVLAQMYCLAKGDYQSLSRYRGLAVGMAHMLGLHQSQARFALDPLATETRKKVFWCQYVLDRFTAAATGLPVMLRENDISTELPVDVDDENVNENGFVPAVPGESTRLSTALALLEASKILGKALDILYPSPVSHEIPVSKLRGVSEDLDAWQRSLPPHLKLVFSQDKPSTNVTGSRSPLLSLVYYYIRTLIHRPAACFGSSTIANPSILSIADSSKHIIQILELLDERCLSFSLSINRLEVAYLSGLGLLWQSLGLKQDSKLAKETQKILLTVRKQLEAASAAAGSEFRALTSIITGSNSNKQLSPAPKPEALSPKRALQSLQSRISLGPNSKNTKPQTASRRNTVTGNGALTDSQLSDTSHHVRNVSHQAGFQNLLAKRRTADLSTDTNLDYYPVQNESIRAMSCTDLSAAPLSAADWEFILSDLDRGQSNIFNSIYGGQECGSDTSPFDSAASGYLGYNAAYPVSNGESVPASQDLSPKTWSPSSGDLPHIYDAPRSVQSRSEASFGSTEDLPTTDSMGMPVAGGISIANPLKGIMIPSVDDDFIDLGFFDGWEQQLMTS